MEEGAPLLWAKQNPETGAKLLRQLSRAQLHLWQEIGRKGISLTDLEIRHASRDMRKEVRDLEERGVVLLEEQPADESREAFSASGQADEDSPPLEEEVDRRVRQSSVQARRPRRSTAAVEKNSLTKKRKQSPTAPAHTEDLGFLDDDDVDEDEGDEEPGEKTEKTLPAVPPKRQARSTAAIEKPTRNPKSKRKQAATAATPTHSKATAKVGSKAEAKAKAKLEAKEKANAAADAEAQTRAKLDEWAKAEAEVRAKAKPEAKTKAKPGAKEKAQELGEKTAPASPVARKRTTKPTAAVEKSDLTEKRKQSPTQPAHTEELGDETKKVGPAKPAKRKARSSVAIERPVRAKHRERTRFPTESPPKSPAGPTPKPTMRTEALADWATGASDSMQDESPPRGPDQTPLEEWAARGTKASTKPGMTNPLAKRGTGAREEGPPPSRGQRPIHGTDSIAIGRPQRGESELDIDIMELDGDELTEQERALMDLDVDLSVEEKRRIIDVSRAVRSGDICGLLGLENTAARKEIKRAYFSLSQELHPDQYFGRKIGSFKPILEQAFTSLAQYVKALNDKRTTLPSSFRESGKARRKSQRFHISLRAQVKCESWNGPEWTVIQDISDGGIFLITDVPAILGEDIRINVDSPNGTIGIVGKVVSMREADSARRERRNGGLGVQFSSAAEVDYKRLKDLLDEAKKHTPAFSASVPVKSLSAQKLENSTKAIHRKQHIIGIDLGTTNTAVSAAIDGRVQIIPWPDGSYSMPSVVSFPERGRCVVGYEAQRNLLTDPRNVINSGKRLIGRQFDDPEIASYMSDARFKNYKGPDGTIIANLWGEDYAMAQICSYLFSAAKHAATKTLGSEPKKAVLTIPVSFTPKQIEAMRKAAKLAQLDVVEVIEEPCAAAIANQGQKDFKGIVGVYDFGGGTFDFSLVEAGTGDLQILATTGDSWLGGDDFDLAIADAAANMFWKAEGTDLRQKAVEWQNLLHACEQAKRELSRKERAQVVVPDVGRNANGSVDLRINLARNKVELLWAEPIQRSIDTCKQALSLAGVPMGGLSAIYLSGGTSYIPAIRRSLMKSFGVPVHLGLAPEHAVCAGAGIRAAVLQGI